MLRIKGQMETPETPVEETPEAPVEQEQAVSEPAAVPVKPMKFSADKVDPMVARYMTADMGPFICANCDHYTDSGECDVVSGPIDPEGVCILFTPGPEATDVQPIEDAEAEPVEVTDEQ